MLRRLQCVSKGQHCRSSVRAVHGGHGICACHHVQVTVTVALLQLQLLAAGLQRLSPSSIVTRHWNCHPVPSGRCATLALHRGVELELALVFCSQGGQALHYPTFMELFIGSFHSSGRGSSCGSTPSVCDDVNVALFHCAQEASNLRLPNAAARRLAILYGTIRSGHGACSEARTPMDTSRPAAL